MRARLPAILTKTRRFSPHYINRVVQTIRDEAVFVGLKLPGGIVAEIEAFARSEPLHAIMIQKVPHSYILTL